MGNLFFAVFALSFLPALAALNASMLTYLGIVWWSVFIGLFLGGIIDYFVPDGFIVRVLGKRSKVTLIKAVIAAFLMAGVATDYTEIGLLWTNIGKRTAMWLPVVTVPQILIFATLLNQFAN